MFSNTWQYDNSVEKNYHVTFKIKYLPNGGVFRTSFYTTEFDEVSAVHKALKKLSLRDNEDGKDVILTAKAVSTGTV